jgi:hypothetical protein
MTGTLTFRQDLRRPDGGGVAPIRRPGSPAQESARKRKNCGKKDTAGIPHRGTVI